MQIQTFSVRILSPEEAEVQLALPCLLILTGIAQPLFPLGSRGKPSLIVLITGNQPSKLFENSSLLPCRVDGRQWKTGVLPVLQDPQWRVLNNPLNKALMNTEGHKELANLIGKALKESFIRAGWGPQSVG